MTTYCLDFDYPSPPLTSNQRFHWAKKKDITRNVRALTEAKAQILDIPELAHANVELHWFVNTKHRRDVDNVVPTLKAMCDGLVDAGIVPDDTPEYMTKWMPFIHYAADSAPRMTLRVSGEVAA